ncbi:hypothetical protein EJB05_15064, partial [Eragrostis curvula]
MASRQVQLFATAAIVVAVACLPALAAAGAVEWTVGDDGGWRPRFNETFWSDTPIRTSESATFCVRPVLCRMHTLFMPFFSSSPFEIIHYSCVSAVDDDHRSLFKYPVGQHTVVEVHSVDFRHCNLHGNRLGKWTSGNDFVLLDKLGWRWFICDVPNHCEQGMKMAINILEDARATAPTTPPPPPPSQSSAPVVGYTTGGAAAAAAAAVVAAALAF